MRLLQSLKSTQWVMWSSPLLLLVLVFTLSASTNPPHSRVTQPLAVTTSTMALTVAPTTTTSTTAPRRAPPATTTTITTITTLPASSTKSAATTTRTGGLSGANSSNVTASNVGFVASAPAVSASSGALRGSITPALGVAVVPLAGPATWLLSAGADLDATLQCGGATVAVESPFVVGAGENCQLTLAPIDSSLTVTWLLTPTN